MKKTIALIVTVLTVVPGLAQADNFRPLAPGFSGPDIKHGNAQVPPMWRGNMMHPRQRIHAFGYNRSQQRYPARPAMHPNRPTMQQRPMMPRQAQAPRWNPQQRQAMRPVRPTMQQRPMMPRQAQAPRWNPQQRQAMRPGRSTMQQRPMMPRQTYRWNPRQSMAAKQRAPHHPLYQSSSRPMPHKMYRWPQGYRHQPGVQYKPTSMQPGMTRLSAVKRPLQASQWQNHKRVQTMHAPYASPKLPFRKARFQR